ncbi:MAG: hypothetical protein V1837_02300 [Candidatus Woesearchaeota archaeon]
MILESYDDIFSDFDPRPYSERALSDDFLNECRKASIDKGYDLELRFLVPGRKRRATDEEHIRHRLMEHFQKHFIQKEIEQKAIKRQGWAWAIIGICMIFVAALISNFEGLINKFLLVVFEPGGWFTTWTGLDKIFSDAPRRMPEYKFYKKMASSQIIFNSC